MRSSTTSRPRKSSRLAVLRHGLREPVGNPYIIMHVLMYAVASFFLVLRVSRAISRIFQWYDRFT